MAKNRQQRLVRDMAQSGIDMQEEFTRQLPTVSGDKGLQAEDLVELYLKANFEQRHQMFIEVFGSLGADGLEMIGDVYREAQKRLAGEVS